MPTYFTNLTKDYQEKEYMSTNKLRRGVQHIKISRVNDKELEGLLQVTGTACMVENSLTV
jgi:hypothetical protein